MLTLCLRVSSALTVRLAPPRLLSAGLASSASSNRPLRSALWGHDLVVCPRLLLTPLPHTATHAASPYPPHLFLQRLFITSLLMDASFSLFNMTFSFLSSDLVSLPSPASTSDRSLARVSAAPRPPSHPRRLMTALVLALHLLFVSRVIVSFLSHTFIIVLIPFSVASSPRL